jgi:DNA-binding response OmpR family regulator
MTAAGPCRILVVDDEPDLLRGLRVNLERYGYEVLTSETGEQALELAFRSRPDLIVLDVMLPGMDGFETCAELRKRGLRSPIIMLTARSEVVDRVVGLEIGADDYITKPFSLRELVARVRARLRDHAPGPAPPSHVRLGDVEVDFERFTATRRGVRLPLTPSEFDLLGFLVARAGEVVSREALVQEVLGYDSGSTTRTVDTHVANLRKKIEDDPAEPRFLQTVYGHGYRLVTD